MRDSISSAASRVQFLTAKVARAYVVVWLVVASIAMLLIAAIIAAPFGQAHGNSQFASLIYRAFSFVCHQIPERSFHLEGNKFAVCSRCTGLYSGFAFAVLAYPLARPLRKSDTPSIFWLILAAAPLAIDFSLGYFNIWSNTQFTRFATGALLSSVAAFYVVPGLIDLSSNLVDRLSHGPRN